MSYIPILLGRNPWDYSSVYYKLRYFGSNGIFAMSQYGKSSLAKIFSLGIQQHDPYIKQIIFDYHSEWKKQVTQYNWDSTTPMSALNPFVASNFSFKLSDFIGDKSAFISLGFTPSGAALIAELLKYKFLYNDDPNKFGQFLNSLPTDSWSHEEFKTQYKNVDIGVINPALQRSISQYWLEVKDYFYVPNGKYKYLNWREILSRQNYIIIDLSAETDDDLPRARFLAGKVIQRIIEKLEHKNRNEQWVIFVEEADKLCPRIDTTDLGMRRYPSSLKGFAELSLKLQKKGLVIFFITQSFSLLPREITKTMHSQIIGRLGYGDPNYNMARKLYWDPDKNIREFYYIDIGGTYQRFTPNVASCVVQ